MSRMGTPLRSLLAFVVVLPSVISASAARATRDDVEKPRCAVLPLTAKRIPKATVSVLDELLVGEVDRHDRFQVIGTTDINAMLGLERMKEALGCSDVACAAEIGGALGVRYMIAGSASRLGSALIVTLKLIDTHDQTVLARARHKVPNEEDKYSEALSIAVAKLFGKRAPAPQLAGGGADLAHGATGSGPGDLWIQSEPVGAEVIVDGKRRGKTPVRVSRLLAGPHRLVLRYDVSSALTGPPGEPPSLTG